MAWVYSLWVKSELTSEQEELRSYFDGKAIFVNKKEYAVRAYISGMVTVDEISQYGITSQRDAEEMTSIGFELYKLLKEAPDFLYAFAGVEVDGYAEIRDFKEDPEYYLNFKGCVIHKEFYEKIKGKKQMNDFSEKYFWTPYQGEVCNNRLA